MSSSIAFFPWVAVNKIVRIGPVKLIPFVRGKLPGDLPKARQSAIDAVLNAYTERGKHRVLKATILEVGRWTTGSSPTQSLKRLFMAKEALTFAALAERRLFSGHLGYWCANTFTLVVQRYSVDDVNGFAYTTRRRDGGTSNYWTSDEFTFQRPPHVHKPLGLKWDSALLKMFLSSKRNDWLDAAIEFNHANTDSSDFEPYVEMIMMKSAFERLMNVGHKVDEFVRALLSVVGPARPGEAKGPLRNKWCAARPKAKRLLEAWAREFCDRRGVAAHGVHRGGDRFVWSEKAHLAFASILFPLLFKKKAADQGDYVMSGADIERLRRIDEYFEHDPFSPKYNMVGQTTHPWGAIDDVCRTHGLAKILIEWPSHRHRQPQRVKTSS